jgi:para-aminobenzoate synthetase component I
MSVLLQEIKTTLDAFTVYSIFKDEVNVAFLDSGCDHKTLGRYSFIGVNPFIVLYGRNGQYKINGVTRQGDVFQLLQTLLARYKTINETEIPFTGGCIGYLAYDLGLNLNGVSMTATDDLMLPHYYFNFYDNLIIFDHACGRQYISACGVLTDHRSSISRIEELIAKQNKLKDQAVIKTDARLESSFTKEEYLEAVRKVKSYIRNGDIYIANLTQRFYARTKKDAYTIYRDLRTINPAPFAAFLRLENFDVISSSPERFIRITQQKVETRPIKGTRPRGRNAGEDEFFKNELFNSEKDKAELLMIVDLERNDLSKVCKPYSVKVTDLFKLEQYSTVFHLVSTIVGTLREETDSIQCLQTCFPGGSISGAPKIKAMEIIDELEPLSRSLYTGCIGYFSLDGNADFNIVIRTLIKQGEKVYFGVGGGITWDSKEEDEYQETLVKSKALIEVI